MGFGGVHWMHWRVGLGKDFALHLYLLFMNRCICEPKKWVSASTRLNSTSKKKGVKLSHGESSVCDLTVTRAAPGGKVDSV